MGHAIIADIPQCEYCKPCVHYKYLYQNGDKSSPKVCLYILDAGHMLPCPTGDGCTERATPEEWAKTALGKSQERHSQYRRKGGRTKSVKDSSSDTDANLLHMVSQGYTVNQIDQRLREMRDA